MHRTKTFDIEQRHNIEREFHDNWAREIQVDSLLVEDFFEAETAIENRMALQKLGDLKDKRILDLGCGAGESSVYFAIKGGDVFAVDISTEMLKKTKELSERYGVKVKLFNMEAEKLKFENNYFDFVFGNNVLHHCDIKLSIKEIYRVLKNNGKAIFIEPLGYNPIINIYRKISRRLRTRTEAPFIYSHLDYMRDCFSEIQYENYWFFSLIVFAHMYLIKRINPASDRYWKTIIKESRTYAKILKFLYRLDSIILKIFPFIGRYCWNIMIILTK